MEEGERNEHEETLFSNILLMSAALGFQVPNDTFPFPFHGGTFPLES